MGLTIHYRLQFTDALEPDEARALVRTAHRRAAALLKRRVLGRITPVVSTAAQTPWSGEWVREKRGGETALHSLSPSGGWFFAVQPDEACEPAEFGLCRYPATWRIGGRVRRTGCRGWSFRGSCKTQYASTHGAEHFLQCHRAVIDLALIWQRLGCAVTLTDEGGYWPERNKAKLQAAVGQMNRLVAGLAGALKDAAGDHPAGVQSPIFDHPQFEHLEAEGVARDGLQIEQAAKAIARANRGRGAGGWK
jgi:hypothetical protein